MRNDKAIILVANGARLRYLDYLNDQSCPGWNKSFEIIELFERKDAGRPHFVDPTRTTDHLLQRWNNSEFRKVYAEKNLAFYPDELRKAGVGIVESNYAALTKEINSDLKRHNLHWLEHARLQCGRSDIQYISPEAWYQQFTELSYGWIGQGLLKQLRVINAKELRCAFQLHPADELGRRICHAYFKDTEAGSSSIAIKDVLEHMYHGVIECDLDSHAPFGSFSGDVVYLYEDGLWSGVELVKRLSKIKSFLTSSSTPINIKFKFAVSSDAGLLSGRLFISREKLLNIEIERGGIDHISFISPQKLAGIYHDQFSDDDQFRKIIDAIIQPYAFSSNEIWGEKQSDAMEICAEIGRQLVRPWLKRTKGDDDLDRKTEKWALGAFGFSSTLAFAKSIPKPVLPLFWLSGDISVNGQKFFWRPLFWDVRRSGSLPYQADHL